MEPGVIAPINLAGMAPRFLIKHEKIIEKANISLLEATGSPLLERIPERTKPENGVPSFKLNRWLNVAV